MHSQITYFLRDILRQPKELRWTLEHLTGAGAEAITAAASAIGKAKYVYLTGIGSSWHAALNVAPMFQEAARPVHLIEASELLEFGAFPADTAVVVISRSGRSIEIVRLAEKAKRVGAAVIGITNAPEGMLAEEAEFPIVLPIALDHAISVNTYSTLAAAAGILARTVIGGFGAEEAGELADAVDEAGHTISGWQKQIAAMVCTRTYDIFSGARLEFWDGAGSAAALGRRREGSRDGDGNGSISTRAARNGAGADEGSGSGDSARSAEAGSIGDADRAGNSR
jgi:fructoselysine-6-P-deglycase FrlB-like protein